MTMRFLQNIFAAIGIRVGANADYAINGLSVPTVQVHAVGDGAISLSSWNSGYTGRFQFLKSRGGAIGTRGAVQLYDTLGTFEWGGDDGTNFALAGQIVCYVDGTIASGKIQSSFQFNPTDANGARTTVMSLKSSGALFQATASFQNAIGINLTNGTSNLIAFNNNGVAGPTQSTRSVGTKLVLFPNLSAASLDYAFGIESGAMWISGGIIKMYGNAAVNYMTFFNDAGYFGFSTTGIAAPSFSTRSAGTKIVLYPSLSSSYLDFAIGVESGCLWFSAPYINLYGSDAVRRVVIDTNAGNINATNAVTSSKLYIGGNADDVGGAWTTWTPTWTANAGGAGFAQGGDVTAAYKLVGKTLHFRLYNNPTFTTSPTIIGATLPNNLVAKNGQVAHCLQLNSNPITGSTYADGTNILKIRPYNGGSFTSGNYIIVSGTIEVG